MTPRSRSFSRRSSPTSFACVDLGGTRIRGAFARDPQRIERRDERETPTSGRPDIEAALAESVRAAAGAARDLEAVGVAAPGPLDHRTGVVHQAPNLTDFRDVPLAADLQRLLGVPVFVDRDTVVAALAEAMAGAAQGARDFVYVTISTGIGGAIVSHGRMVRGVTGTAGEIGHWPVDPDGPRCGCGTSGCIESIASGSAIARAFGAESAAATFTAARAGDESARAILDRAGRALGDLAVGAVNLLNPALVVVGGGVTRNEPKFVLGAMRDAVERRAFAVPARAVRIVPAALGDDVGLVGALLMARERLAGRDPLG